jgi:prephenate dehydrogenase
MLEGVRCVVCHAERHDDVVDYAADSALAHMLNVQLQP